MKKLAILLFLCVVAVVIGKSPGTGKNEMSASLLYNVEALAADEYMRPVQCYGVGSVDCPAADIKVKSFYIGYNLEE